MEQSQIDLTTVQTISSVSYSKEDLWNWLAVCSYGSSFIPTFIVLPAGYQPHSDECTLPTAQERSKAEKFYGSDLVHY